MHQVTTRIAEGGTVIIPAEMRLAIGLEVGDEVILRLGRGELHIMTRAEAVRRAQALVSSKADNRQSLVDELAYERRAEAASE